MLQLSAGWPPKTTLLSRITAIIYAWCVALSVFGPVYALPFFSVVILDARLPFVKYFVWAFFCSASLVDRFFRLAPTRRRLVGKLAALRAGRFKSFKRNKQQAKKTANFPVLSVMEIAFGLKLPTAKTRWKVKVEKSSAQCSVCSWVCVQLSGWSQCETGANVETEAARATANLQLQPRSCAPPCKWDCCAQLFWKNENCACEPSAKSFTPNKRQTVKKTSSRFQLRELKEIEICLQYRWIAIWDKNA